MRQNLRSARTYGCTTSAADECGKSARAREIAHFALRGALRDADDELASLLKEKCQVAAARKLQEKWRGRSRRAKELAVTRMPPENADRILDSRMGPGTYFTTPVQALRYTVGKVTALPSSTSKNRRKILRSRDMARLYNVRVMSGFTGTIITRYPKIS